MKLSSIASCLTLVASVFAAPVETTENDTLSIPTEAIINYLDLEGAKDIAILPMANSTDSGILFLNTTVLDQALATENESSSLSKREADAWHWIKLAWGQPIYKRDATPDANPWHWIDLSWGQPIYKREAKPDAEAWHWINLAWGQPIY